MSVESAPARATKSCSPHISPHVSGGDTTMLPHELWRLRWLGPLHDEQARLCARSMFFDYFISKMVSGTCRVLCLEFAHACAHNPETRVRPDKCVSCLRRQAEVGWLLSSRSCWCLDEGLHFPPGSHQRGALCGTP